MNYTTDTAIVDSETVQDLCDEHGLDIDAVAVYCDNLRISAQDLDRKSTRLNSSHT